MCRRVASAQRSSDCARIGSAKISAKRGPRQNEEADAKTAKANRLIAGVRRLGRICALMSDLFGYRGE
jgi:hypothetical protein